MPEGPLSGPRLSNIGPLSRATEEEVRAKWDSCPSSGKAKRICEEYKVQSLAILEDQGFFARCGSLKEINSGQCFKVAEGVASVVDGITVLRVGDGDHFWIEYNGKHYDAEAPSGVDDYEELPFFQRTSDSFHINSTRLAKPEGVDYPVETVEDTIVDVTDKVKSGGL